ncbi:MAG: DUF5685 family protein [Clostridiales bacterium]|nr:DUF5685 family protein [Clostridiales bacterium]MDY4035873.1 DUF5685 family protein [Candidatus Pseudoscilispira sp.]
MFGYVRPVMDKLGQEEQERFQEAYCGLCYELGRQYGVLARCMLNYDFTFLAILLESDVPHCTSYRCPCKHFCKKERLDTSPALETAADVSVILAWWKLRDEIEDSRSIRTAVCRLLSLLIRRAYRKAARKRPAFARTVEDALFSLRRMEEEKTASLDRPADAFARLLAAAAEEVGTETERRIHHQMLYQLGRWIYLIDALDDLQDDAAQGRYNPLIYRYGLRNGQIGGEDRDRLVATLDHSARLIASAFALKEPTAWTALLENIIYYGLPLTGRLVLEGRWNTAAGEQHCFSMGHDMAESERMASDT